MTDEERGTWRHYQGRFAADARRIMDRLREPEWSGSPDPADPDNYWIDDATGERVNAHTGEREKVRA